MLRHSSARRLITVFVSAGITAITGALYAQTQKMAGSGGKIPQVVSVFPPGAQRGTSVELDIKGKNLAGVSGLRFNSDSIKVDKLEAKGADRVIASVTVADDAEVDIVELRATSDDGVSNLRLFRIDELKQLNETSEKNDEPKQAQTIEFPAVVNGQLGNADIDCFRISITEKKRLILEVEARRLGSPADVRLRVVDPDGRPVADAATTVAIQPDERIVRDFEPGEYIVAVEDAQYVGGDGSVYRLRIGNWPYATSLFPIGGRRGESVQVRLEGGNLTEPLVQTVTVPNDSSLASMTLRFPTPEGTLWAPMQFAIGHEPELEEPESGDDAAPVVSVPVVVNGRIGTPGDKDRVRVEAKKGQKFAIEVHAERLGSWLDSVLTVTDKAGKQLAENDDMVSAPQQRQQNQPAGRRPTSDSRIDFTAPADGEYTIRVDDRFNAGGPESVYRLRIVPLEPNFLLHVGAVPQKQQQRVATPPGPTDTLNLEPGKTATVSVVATRLGYDGEIELVARGLPEGVTAEPVKIAAKQPGGQIVLKADPSAQASLASIQIVGTAKINDQQVERVVENDIVLSSLDTIHVSRRVLTDFSLAIARRMPPPEISIKVDSDATLARGTESELKVQVERKNGFNGPVTLEIKKLPAGVTAPKTTIADGKNETTVKLTGKSDAALGAHKIQLVSQATAGSNKLESSAEVSLSVVVPFELAIEVEEKELELVVGETRTLKVAVKRHADLSGPIELTVAGLPSGVSASPDKIPPGDTEVELTLQVDDDAKPNKNKKGIKIQAASMIGKQKVKFETAPIPTSVRSSD